jgi:hypothetical protein
MPAATFTFAQDFKEQLGKAIHNLSTHTIKVALSNTAPNVATMAALADITQISSGGGYTGGAGGGVALSGVSYTESAGTGTFIATDLVITASGGSVGPFRYAWHYNDTATSPVDALIGYLDYGSSITLADTETLTLDYTTSIFTVA